MQLFLASLLLLIFQATASESSCEERSHLKDTILHRHTVNGYGFHSKCWKILNPSKQTVTLKGDFLDFKEKYCGYVNITVTVNNTDYRLCDGERYNNDVINGDTDVLVKFTADQSKIYDGCELTLQLSYEMADSQSFCEERNQLKDTISHRYIVNGYGSYSKCWKILNPSRQPVILKGDILDFIDKKCKDVNITVTVNNKVYRLCDSGRYNNDVIIGTTDVLIEFTVNKKKVSDGCELTLELSYEMGIPNIPEVKEARLRLIDWLKNKRNPSWGWKENTARAIIALYLGDGATFNGTNLHEELMAKQLEVRTATALLGQPLASERLSMFINALLVTYRNPHNFYGQNLVSLLKEQVTATGNFTHPITYLTLCNANETWPPKALEDLSDILNSEHKFPFIKDFQAIAVMALSCYRNSNNSLDEFENGTLTLDYERTVQELKEHQLSDGSFGNVHTTALISQALISSGLENATSWYSGAVEYLIKELNSSSVDFSAVTLSLPVLNGKSFVDIAKVNCSSARRHEEAPEHLMLEDGNHIIM